ncbi:MAG: MarR family transcriptional regulator [Oscillospiraceae bacterium]|nr:MarR family transcriptional regulator [Oscillospiraceae bacterium]
MDMLNTQLKRFNLLMSEIDKAYHQAAQKLGLSDSAMMILYTLCSNDGECMLGDITSCIGKQTVNSALRRLEADGVVTAEPAGGRKKKLRLTESGRQLAENTVSRIIRIENEIFDEWSAEDKAAYIELTRQYLTMFKEKMKDL